MHFLKASLVACSFSIAAATGIINGQVRNAIRAAAEAQITEPPVVDKRGWDDIANSAGNLAKSQAGDIADGVQSHAENVASKGQSIADDAKSNIGDVASKGASLGKFLADDVKTRAGDAVSKAETFADGAVSRVSDAAGDAKTWVSTKIVAASSGVDNVRSRVSDLTATGTAATATGSTAAAATSSKDNSADGALGRNSGAIAAAIAVGAVAFGFIFV